MRYKMGIDLGGTKTEVIVLDQEQQSIYRERVATPATSYAEILDSLCGLVDNVQAKLNLDMSIGIGIPGSLSPDSGLLRNSNTICMNGQPFARDLAHRLGREVRIGNDANCFALSEALGGAGQSSELVFGVILGTGTGGGLVINGTLVNGPHSISGEWGHNPLPWLRDEDGAPGCYCGKQACIETFLSGPGFARNFKDRFGKSLSSEQIIAAAVDGDADCQTMLNLYCDQMARALAHVINILDPHAIVLGGGMSNIDTIYRDVPELLGNYVFSEFASTPILRAERGDASGVFGAALLWP